MINSNDKNYEINNANALCENMISLNVFNCQPISLRNHVFKKLIRNAIRAPNSLDPDHVPYFVGPDLGQKCLQSSKNHEQSSMLQFQLMLLTFTYLGALNQTA